MYRSVTFYWILPYKYIIFTDRENLIYNGAKMKLNNAKTFGKIVRKCRKKRGATQIQVAALANTGLRFISELENGKPTVQLDKALRVAKVLGIKIEILDMGDNKK